MKAVNSQRVKRERTARLRGLQETAWCGNGEILLVVGGHMILQGSQRSAIFCGPRFQGTKIDICDR